MYADRRITRILLTDLLDCIIPLHQLVRGMKCNGTRMDADRGITRISLIDLLDCFNLRHPLIRLNPPGEIQWNADKGGSWDYTDFGF
jgi:hypothetical protein